MTSSRYLYNGWSFLEQLIGDQLSLLLRESNASPAKHFARIEAAPITELVLEDRFSSSA